MERIRGFTLIELLTTVFIAVILLTVAVPSFRNMILNNRITTAANSLVGFLNTARSDAIREGRVAKLCVPDAATCSGSNWVSGWQIWVDGNGDGTADSNEIVRTESAMAGSITITAAGFAHSGYVQYLPTGLSGSSGTFTVCDSSRSGENGVLISVSTTGQVVSSTVTCS